MRETTAGVVALLALCAVLLPGLAWAQDPISPGEPARPTATGSLLGQVVDPEGQPLPEVQVQIRGDGAEQTAFTDLSGRFRFLALPPGEYDLTTTLEGFTVETRQVDVRIGQSSRVTVILGGPISPGEPDGGNGGGSSGEDARPPVDPPEPVPRPDRSRSVIVVERRYHDDLALQEGLNAERADGRELQAIIPMSPGTSLFVYRRRSDAAPCTVLVDAGGEGRLQAHRLETRIRQQVNKTFLGVHFLRSGATALVFRDDS